MTTVLLHLRRYFPDWDADVECRASCKGLLAGLCRHAYELGRAPQGRYTYVRRLPWHEPDQTYADSPSTKAERCLREVFNIRPRKELCRYVVSADNEGSTRAAEMAAAIGRPFVLIHYQGSSARRNKNLDERHVRLLCTYIRQCGHEPVILDWGAHARIEAHRVAPSPNELAALCDRAAWCVGIDSGPGHVMAATRTPTTIIWTRHHPVNYFGLAANVRHLVPRNHAQFIRGDRDTGVTYFRENYESSTYVRLDRSLRLLASEILAANEFTVDGDHFVRRQFHEQDMIIVRDVYFNDCYRIAELTQPPRYVVDVGAHIGAFATRVHDRVRRARIVCVEANPANIDVLSANVEAIADVLPAACTYEPGPARLASTVFPGTENTGGSTISPVGNDRRYRDAGEVPKVTLEEIMRRFEFPRIDLLKLDCEGSEYSILQNCRLEHIANVVGEFHDRRRFDELVRRRFCNWKLRILKDATPGLFWLCRE